MNGSHPIAIAIAGGSGSGKTWLARAILRRLRPHAALLSLDDFYRDLSDLPPARRERVNFDTPEALDWPLLGECLDGILAGRAVPLPRYDFTSHTRRGTRRRWKPRPIVLLEGLWPWQRPEFRTRFALRIFRDTPVGQRLERRRTRDVRDRGRTADSVDRQWRRQVQPMYRRHVASQRRHAHLVLDAEIDRRGLAELACRIRQLAGLE